MNVRQAVSRLPPLAYHVLSMILQASDIVACYLTHKSITPLTDYVALGQTPEYTYKPPVSWPVSLNAAAIRALWESDGKIKRKVGLPNRVHLGLLGILLNLDRPGENRGLILDYLAEHGVSTRSVMQCITHCRTLGLMRTVRSRPHAWRKRVRTPVKL